MTFQSGTWATSIFWSIWFIKKKEMPKVGGIKCLYKFEMDGNGSLYFYE